MGDLFDTFILRAVARGCGDVTADGHTLSFLSSVASAPSVCAGGIGALFPCANTVPISLLSTHSQEKYLM
jgi:hypothetical protein